MPQRLEEMWNITPRCSVIDCTIDKVVFTNAQINTAQQREQ